MIRMRSALLMVSLLALAACADLSAVSNFAKLGSDVTSSGAALNSYVDAINEEARTAPEARKAELRQQAAEAPAHVETAKLGLQALSLYLSTLSKLADNKPVTDVKASAGKIIAGLQTAGVVDKSIADPAGALARLLFSAALDAWRRMAVSDLISDANEPAQKVGLALADFAGDIAARYRRDLVQARNFYAREQQGTSDRAAKLSLEEWLQYHTKAYEKGEAQALAAEKILRKLVQAQADLNAHKTELNGAALKELLSGYADDIVKASKLLPIN